MEGQLSSVKWISLKSTLNKLNTVLFTTPLEPLYFLGALLEYSGT